MLKSPRLQKNKNAFTLLEVMIAIFVIVVGIVGTISLIQQTISFIALSSSRLVASYLAQEGIEIVRNIRDGNWLETRTAPNPWDEGLTDCSGGCTADYKHSYGPNQLDPTLPAYSNQFLNIDVDGFYSYATGSPTKFKRKITIISDFDAGAPRLKVSVLVEWQQIGKTQQVTAQEYLYNWR